MTDTVNLRALSLDLLIEINEKGQYSHLVLRDVLDKYQYLSKQERSFIPSGISLRSFSKSSPVV